MRIATQFGLAALLLAASVNLALAAGGKAFTNAKEAGPDFQVQGEYVGEKTIDGKRQKWGTQVIALGDGKFDAVGYPGGLPGDGWNQKTKKKVSGKTEGDATVFKTEGGDTLTIRGGVLTATNSSGDKIGTLEKVHRESKTLGAKAPAGAIVLFDGKSVDAWEGGQMTEDGLLMQGTKSKQNAKSYTTHIEFRLPFMPEARGQGRGNSGFYVQGRYEIQMLDSFGLEGLDNECGGIYKASKPILNMCYPPLSWQTYDVDFTAPVFEGDKKVKNAVITVRHNGVVIHDGLELPAETPGGLSGESPQGGPAVMLQNHGNPVRYRNIWIVEKK
jgi:hypothetical protein